jgi:hypothetical protein
MKYNSFLLLTMMMFVLSSCENFLDPKISDEVTYEQMITQPDMVRGLVNYVYRVIPSSFEGVSGGFLECATDDALTNILASNINKMVELPTYWSATNNPLNIWNARYEDIRDLNNFFDIMKKYNIRFKKTGDADNNQFTKITMGEAYFLRAYCEFELLKTFGGKDVNGKMMGFPIVTTLLSTTDIPNLARNTYSECVAQIVTDIDSAMVYLPKSWDKTTFKYSNQDNLGRPTDVACLALKSRLRLYEASPAFTDGLSDAEKTQKWRTAAETAKEAIDSIGFGLPRIYDVTNISAKFYNDPQSAELILRRMVGTSSGDLAMATRNFLPSIYGSGNCNPTQNLVDAFPMANGYPITADVAKTGYSETNMYLSRDPRFYMSILFNGATFKTTKVETFEGGKDMAGFGRATIENSTRTGYYLRKWVSSKANLVPGSTTNDFHYGVAFRQAELYLNFAEAANEAVGPTTAIKGMTAQNAIAEVRKRAGIAPVSADNYLIEQAASASNFRTLIKNERRIELCFEGHRFYDLRRWKDPLNTTIQRIKITPTAVVGTYTYEKVNLLTLPFSNTKYYCPLPITELYKATNLTQNEGW